VTPMTRAHASRLSLIGAALITAGMLQPSLAGAQAAARAAEKDAVVPLTDLVLFTSGVGFFQHEGTVEGNARMALTFSADQVNDLLKSLVLRDMDGGSIQSVTYSSRDPITRTLKSFSVDLTANTTLAGLLTQTRGEAVELVLPDKVTGTIISVERREEQQGEKGFIAGEFLNLNTQTGIRSIALSQIQGIRFLRKEIQDDLAQALQVLSSSHGIEKKTVVLHFTGSGKRRVRIGYILEAPVWKTSYRLVLAEKEGHLLQGWAMVENTSDTDWKAVSLALVSGRPITFVMDLYQPLYLQRPEVQLELYESLRPKTYQMAMGEPAPETEMMDEEAGFSAKRAEAPAAKSAPAPSMTRESARAPAGGAASSRDFAVNQGVSAMAQAGEVGSLFQYAIEKPVTLPRQQSALLPIVNETIAGERFSIYNESTHPKYPLNAVKLKNTSRLHLMQGPITVFDGGMYAGDAQITDLAAGGEQIISYAMDLDTEVEPLQGPAPETLVTVRISRGIFTYTNKATRERVYNMKNRGTKARTVLVEHPFAAEWTLVSPKDPLERARNVYRFAVPVAAGKTAKLTVTEERMVEQSVSVTSMQGSTIDFYVKSQVVSRSVKDALTKLLVLKQKLADTMDQRNRLETRVKDIGVDQDRIRANMDRLSQSSELYKKYVKTLTDQEEEISKLRDQIAQGRDLEASQRKDVETYILSIDVK
jgi:hypothetical protein